MLNNFCFIKNGLFKDLVTLNGFRNISGFKFGTCLALVSINLASAHNFCQSAWALQLRVWVYLFFLDHPCFLFVTF